MRGEAGGHKVRPYEFEGPTHGQSRLDYPAIADHIPLMSTIKSICVYCASGPGINPAFVAAARRFGQILAEDRIRLVYGGGSIGLMEALSESALDHSSLHRVGSCQVAIARGAD